MCRLRPCTVDDSSNTPGPQGLRLDSISWDLITLPWDPQAAGGYRLDCLVGDTALNERSEYRQGAPSAFLILAVIALAVVALLTCEDTSDDPEPTPTVPPGYFSALPTIEPPIVGDQPGFDIELVPTTEPTSADAPTPAPATDPTDQLTLPNKPELSYPRVGSVLDDLIARILAGEITPEEAAQEAPLHQGDAVAVTIHLSGNVDDVVRFLEANGGSTISVGEDYIEALVPVLLVGQISEQPGVLRVRLTQPSQSFQSQSVAGNGPDPHGSPAWNQAGYRGQGIKVGIIDNGFRGFSDLMGTELPATVAARCYELSDSEPSKNLVDCEDVTSHGTAVAESVMDVAPDVTLFIAQARTPGTVKEATQWMISEGVSVIDHSVGWIFDGPGDGTSPTSESPLNTVDTAVAAGIVWVNAAGNDARNTWFKRGPFSYSTITVDDQERKIINFDGSDFGNGFNGARIQLRWDDSWRGAARDLDLYVRNSDGDIVGASQDYQSGDPYQVPHESILFYGSGEILVADFSTSAPEWIQLTIWSRNPLEHYTGTGSIANPAESANPGMLAVGAAPWSDVDSIEFWSSRGPTPDGRVKPDVVGADCGQTATSSTFCGTSQAAPHVAGMVALVRQRFPDYSPAQVVAYIKDNAEQRISNPDPNNTWGHGFFVLPPVTQQPPPPAPSAPGAPTGVSAVPGNDSLNLSWNAPGQTGGAAITAYDLRHIRSDATNKGDANWTVVQDVWNGAGARGYKLADLDGGTQYDVQVRAVNSAGDGPWSATASGTPTNPTLSSDATLSALTVIPVVIGFHLSVTTYHVGVANDVSQVTVAPAARDTGATVRVNGAAISRGSSRAVSLNEGSNVITITVTAGDGTTTKTYTVTIDRGSDDPFGWKVTDDFQLDLPSGFSPRGLWSRAIASSNGRVFYTACATANANIGASLCAYNLAAREQWDTYHTLATHGNNSPTGIWSDGTTMWVADANDKRIYAYKTASYFRDTSKEFGNLTNAGNHNPAGIWSNGVVLYVADSSDAKLYAYFLSNQEWLSNPGHGYDTLGAAGNTNPSGIWSDGTTMWVADRSDAKIYAYDGATKLRAPAKDFDTLIAAGNTNPWGIWSDGVTMWVADAASKKIFSYNMPPQSALGPLTVPGAPRNLRATARDDTSIGLSWSPPLSDGGAAITGYRIEVSQDGSNWRDYVPYTGSTSTSDGHLALTPGSTYFYRVSARNAIGVGPASNIASATTLAAGVPAAPTITNVTAGTNEVTVVWSAPPSGGGSAITAYDLRHIRSDTPSKVDANWLVVQDVWTGSGARSYVLAGLDDGTRYDVQVRAVNAAGDGPWSATLTGTTAAAVPAAPTQLTTRANGQILIYLSWTAPTNDGGAVITGYRIEVSPDGLSWSDLVANTRNADTTYSHTGLAPASTRHYRVSAINSAGTGPASNVANATTGVAPAPDLVVDTPTVSDSAPVAGASFTLSATVRNQGNGPSPLTTLRYFQSTDSTITTSDTEVGTDSGIGPNPSVMSDESISLTAPVTPGTYYYGACVDSVFDESNTTNNCSAAVTVTVGASATAPGAPTSLTARVNGQTQIDLSWSAPTTNGGAVITGYRIEVSTNGSSWSDLVANTGSATTTYSHTGLTAGSTRHYRVSAISSAGTGAASNTATGVTALAAPPGAPAIGSVTPGAGSLTVSWSAPPSDGGSRITAYDLRHIRSDATNKGDANWTVIQDVWTGSGARSYELAGLDGGAQYDVQARAVNATGDGPWSATATGTTASTETAPASPATAKYRREGATTIVTWDPSAEATYYKVYHSDSRFPRCSLSSSGTALGCVELDGNVAGTTYTHASPDDDDNSYWVTACNSAGCSAIDSANPAQFVDNRPAAPANAQYRHEGSTTVVSWDPSAGATHYKVYYDDFFGTNCRIGSGGSPSFCELLAGNITGTTYTHTSPDADRNYYWVVGCNSAGCSDIDSRNPATLVVTTRSVTAPGAPTVLTATANGQTQIDLSWSAPTTNGGANITGYRIEVSTNGSSWSDLVANTGSATTTYSHTGLTAGSTRHYRVSAINSAGTGTASNTANATTGAASAAVPGAPRVLTATANGQTRIDLSWSAPTTNGGANITGYRIEVSTNGSSWSDLVANTGSATTTYSHTGLTAGSTRHYRVSAINSAGTGPASNTANATTGAASAAVPGAPRVLTATANGQTRIDLSWNAPTTNGGANITGYRIEVSTNGSSWSDLVANTGSATTTYSHTGLTAGSTRHYRVSAINSAGTGPASNTANATTDPTVAAQSDTSACASDGAVADAANNPGLVSDCEALLDARDTLRGTATLNWEAGTFISQWNGITVGGTPRRVTKLDTSGAGLADLTGTIPPELGSLTGLTNLRLSNNKLTGAIPPELGNLANLESLSLWNNELSGAIPSELGNLSNLTFLRLNLNQLAGSIPAELGNLSKLDSLYLGGNRLTGAIPPELGRLTNLQHLLLGGSNYGRNQLTGTIPTELGNLTKLRSLNLWKNSLTGTIPAWLGSQTGMTTLNLAGNQFTGTIPAELGKLTQVNQLWLQDNQLTGTIPAELGSLTNVKELHLGNNRLIGEIPAELANLSGLRQLFLATTS